MIVRTSIRWRGVIFLAEVVRAERAYRVGLSTRPDELPRPGEISTSPRSTRAAERLAHGGRLTREA